MKWFQWKQVVLQAPDKRTARRLLAVIGNVLHREVYQIQEPACKLICFMEYNRTKFYHRKEM